MARTSNIRELRRLEQFFLEQAEACQTPEGKAALKLLAGNYAIAAEMAAGVQARQAFR